MRPKPFVAEPYAEGGRFVREVDTGLLWHRVHHRALYADTDRSGVVYHANYLRYFELGRATLLRDVAVSYREVEEAGYVYPIVDLSMKFVRPLHYDTPMWVHTRPARLERVRVTFEYVITHAETGLLACSGRTLHCALNQCGQVVAVDAKTVLVWQNFPKGADAAP